MTRFLVTLALFMGVITAHGQTVTHTTQQQLEDVEANLQNQIQELSTKLDAIAAAIEKLEGAPTPEPEPEPTGPIAEWFSDSTLGNGLTITSPDHVIPADDLRMNALDAFTVMAWVKSTGGTTTQDIASWWHYPNSRSWVLTRHYNGQYFFEIAGKGNVSGGTVDTQWALVAATYDGSTMQLIVNGKLVGSLNGLSGPLPTATAPILVGGQADGSNWFQGQLDEVRILPRVVTLEEVLLEYEALAPEPDPVPEPTPTLSTYYIRSGANGNGSSWANALPTLPPKLQRGAGYYIAAGTYPGYLVDDPEIGTQRITIRKATEEDHGSAEGWDPAYAGQAVFRGSLRVERSHVLIDGATGGGPGQWREGFGFKVNTKPLGSSCLWTGVNDGSSRTVTDIVFRHLELEGNGPDGAQATNDALEMWLGSQEVTLSHFWAHDLGRAIVWKRTGHLTMEYGWTGLFENTPEQHSEIVSASAAMTIRNNVFTYATGTGGLIFWGGGQKLIENNLFWQEEGKPGWFGYNGVIGAWSHYAVSDILCRNNTFVNIPAHMPIYGSIHNGTANNVAENNRYLNCPNLGGGILTSRTGDVVLDSFSFAEWEKTVR